MAFHDLQIFGVVAGALTVVASVLPLLTKYLVAQGRRKIVFNTTDRYAPLGREVDPKSTESLLGKILAEGRLGKDEERASAKEWVAALSENVKEPSETYDWSQALQQLEAASAYFPAPELERLRTLILEAQRVESCREAANRKIVGHPENKSGMTIKTQPESVTELTERARKLLESSAFSEALQNIEEAHKQFPGDVELERLRTLVLEVQRAKSRRQAASKVTTGTQIAKAQTNVASAAQIARERKRGRGLAFFVMFAIAAVGVSVGIYAGHFDFAVVLRYEMTYHIMFLAVVLLLLLFEYSRMLLRRLDASQGLLLGFAILVFYFAFAAVVHYRHHIAVSADTFFLGIGLFLTMTAGMLVQVIASNYKTAAQLLHVTPAQLIYPLLFSPIVYYTIWVLASTSSSSSQSMFSFYAAFLNGYFWESIVSSAEAAQTKRLSHLAAAAPH